MNFDLGFRVVWLRKLNLFEIIFPLSSLMTSSWELSQPLNQLLTLQNYHDSLIHVNYDLILSEIQLQNLIFKTVMTPLSKRTLEWMLKVKYSYNFLTKAS